MKYKSKNKTFAFIDSQINPEAKPVREKSMSKSSTPKPTLPKNRGAIKKKSVK